MMQTTNIKSLASLLRASFSRSRAFSLVEVLISIVVLALGLVGLAAVFPVVVQQQRSVSDSIQGASVERSAEGLLRGNAALSVRANPLDTSSSSIWRELAAEEVSSTVWSPAGTWDTGLFVNSLANAGRGLNILSTTGDLFIIASSTELTSIPTRERLNPAPFTSRTEPRFVWDIAARRVEIRRLDGATRILTVDRARDDRGDDSIQIATFVRRIDGNIRTDRRGLSFAFTRPEGETEARLPLGADAVGRPTLDGRGIDGNNNNYSAIQRINFTIDADADTGELNRLIPDANSELIAYVRQVGQKLVDRSGQIRTVRSIATTAQGGFPALIIDPPMNSGTIANEVADFTTLEALFTPQIPASVGVYTIDR